MKTLLVALLVSSDGGLKFVYDESPCVPRWSSTPTGCSYVFGRMRGYVLHDVVVGSADVMSTAKCGERVQLCGNVPFTCPCARAADGGR